MNADWPTYLRRFIHRVEDPHRALRAIGSVLGALDGSIPIKDAGIHYLAECTRDATQEIEEALADLYKMR